jgi:hypothetical protein
MRNRQIAGLDVDKEGARERLWIEGAQKRRLADPGRAGDEHRDAARLRQPLFCADELHLLSPVEKAGPARKRDRQERP